MRDLRNAAKFYLYHGLAIIITTMIILSLIAPLTISLTVQANMIIVISIVLLTAFLIYPFERPPTNMLDDFLWCLMLTLIAFITLHFSTNFQHQTYLNLKASAGVFSFALFLHGANRFIGRFYVDSRHASLLVIFFSVFISAIPVWTAPWFDSTNPTQASIQLVLWSSPMTYFASLLDYDYLHSQWFYQHTPYGMYRFNYPDPRYASIGLICSASVLLFFSRLYSHE